MGGMRIGLGGMEGRRQWSDRLLLESPSISVSNLLGDGVFTIICEIVGRVGCL